VQVSPVLLDEYAADAERTAWWLARVERCLALLAD
jgi:O-succinylbenzoate synthase